MTAIAAAAVTLAVMLLATLSGCALLSSSKPDGLIINEVCTSNSGSLLVEGMGSPDWIELYNAGTTDIDLTGYQISRMDKKTNIYELGPCIIKAGEYMVLCCLSAVAPEGSPYQYTGFKLPRDGVALYLKDGKGAKVQELNVPSLDTDVTWAYNEGEYKYCSTPTAGAENMGIFSASLEEIESAPAPVGLVINEASRGFAELYNGGTEPVDLASLCLSDEPGDMSKYRLPFVTLEPGQYFTVSLEGEGTGEYCASFKLSKEENFIYLAYNNAEYDSIDLTGLPEYMSAGRIDGQTVYYGEMTPGAPNAADYVTSLELTEMTDEDPVKINELMLNNNNGVVDEFGDHADWAELYNSSDQPVALKKYFLSDDEEELMKWELPDVELGAGEYIIIYLTKRDTDHHTSFGVGKGEPLVLTDSSKLRKQTVMFPDESRLANISYGLKDGAWVYFGKATPGRANTTAGSEAVTNVERLDREGIFISEISASFEARSGGKDWIELYNASGSEKSLKGIYLSNDEDEPQKYELTGSIPAGGYKVVNASSRSSKAGADTAPFGISQAGETVLLTDSGGETIDRFETGALRYGVTSGRADGDLSGERVFFTTPTKGAANAAPLGGALSAPVFSVDSGFVSGSVTLELTAEEGSSIHYTTDGSEATEASPVYSGPIALNTNTVVSAVASMSGRVTSEPATGTYLFEEKHTVPVICISMPAEDFSRVYSVSEWHSNKSLDIERKCYIEYYEADGSLGTSFPAGIRVAGNSTRVYAQKSLGIYLRNGYGQGSVVYPFFENYPITEFKSLVVRNAGQNCNKSRMADAYANMLFDSLNVDNAQTRFVAVYVNGKYHGVYDLKENQNEDYFAARHGVDADEINVIRRNTFAIAGNKQQITQVYGYAQSWDLSNDEKFNEFAEYVDTDAWIDYIIARSYTADGDMFNQKLWNTQSYSSKWRPIFYDCDFAFGGSTGNTLSRYFVSAGIASPDGSLTNMHIPSALRKNQAWCDKLVERYAEVMKKLPDYSLKLYDKMAAELEPEMARQVKRWGYHKSVSEWKGYVNNMRTVLEKRPDVIVKQIQNEFGVSTERMKELFPDFY